MPRWTPILEPDEAEPARTALIAIGEALRDPPPPYDGRIEDEGERCSLLGREPGFAVFFAYLSRALPGQGYEQLALDALDRALDCVPEIADRRPTFGIGLAGTAWALQHLRGWILPGDEDPVADVDQAVSAITEHLAPSSRFDLSRGAVGYGVYALERLDTMRGTLERIVRWLDAAAERDGEGGAFWRTRPEWLLEHDRRRLPEGLVSTGVLQGALGPIALCAYALAHGVEAERARALLAAAVTWVLRQRLLERPSWAFGAAGIAATLHAAGRAAAEPSWERAALEIARPIARRPVEEVPVPDAGFCSGAAGLAHVFSRLHHRTGEPLFLDAARRWTRRVLSLRGAGLGGFRFYSPEWINDYVPEVPTGMVDLPGVLEGLAGVGLVLLSAAYSIEPSWDRMLLLSWPGEGVS